MGAVEAGLAKESFSCRHFFPTYGLQVASDGISDCIGMEGPRLVGTVELYLPRLPVMRVHPVDGSWSNVAVKSHKDIMYDYTIIQ